MERDVGNKLGVRKRFDVGPKHLPTKHLSPIRDAIACGQIVGGKLDDSGTRFLHARPPRCRLAPIVCRSGATFRSKSKC
jgi:hypothetical protein